jgi:hypothetical protein
MVRSDSPAARPREISSRSSSDRRASDRQTRGGRIPPALPMNSATITGWRPTARAIADALSPRPYRSHKASLYSSVNRGCPNLQLLVVVTEVTVDEVLR